MKIQQVTLVVLVALVGSAASKDWYGWYGPFEHCHDSCPDMCSGTSTCTGGESPTTAAAVTGATGPADFTTVPAGYTPAPGECVCVSSGPSTAGVVPTGAASTAAPGGGVSGPPSNVITCPCQLVNYLWNLTFVLEGTIYYDIYVDWLIEIQITILADQSLSEQEKFFACIASLQSLFVEYVEIEIMLQYQYLAGFGYVCDLFTVVIELQVELSITESLIIIEGGSCALFDAFWNCTSWTSEQHSALTVLFEEIRVSILEISYLSYTDKCILIYQKFYAFFEEHAEWDISIFYNITIEGFGCFGQWYSMCQAYFELYTLDFAIGGTFSECAMMQALYDCGHNTSYDQSTRGQFQQLYSELLSGCSSETDVFVRLELIANITWQYYQLVQWDLTLFWSVSWSYEAYGITCDEDFYELLWLAFFYYRYGFSCSLPLTTTAAAVTTEATTTVATTTVAPCSDSNKVTCFTPSTASGATNHSCPFVQAMWNGYNSGSWNTSCKNALFPIINRCNTYSNSGGTWESIATTILNYLGTSNKGPTNNAVYQQLIITSTIQINGVAWGRLCDMAACVNTTYSNNAALVCSS